MEISPATAVPRFANGSSADPAPSTSPAPDFGQAVRSARSSVSHAALAARTTLATNGSGFAQARSAVLQTATEGTVLLRGARLLASPAQAPQLPDLIAAESMIRRGIDAISRAHSPADGAVLEALGAFDMTARHLAAVQAREATQPA